jgi:hypothetical protein
VEGQLFDLEYVTNVRLEAEGYGLDMAEINSVEGMA